MLREPLIEDNLDWAVIYVVYDISNNVVAKTYDVIHNCLKKDIKPKMFNILQSYQQNTIIVKLDEFYSNNLKQKLNLN